MSRCLLTADFFAVVGGAGGGVAGAGDGATSRGDVVVDAGDSLPAEVLGGLLHVLWLLVQKDGHKLRVAIVRRSFPGWVPHYSIVLGDDP